MNPGPGQEMVRVHVRTLQLENFDETLHPGLTLAALKQQLVVERTRFGEWITVDELHQIADALTLHLRNLGYVFHSVYLPPQRVQGGVVVLRVQQGTLTDVHVINESTLTDNRFSDVFKGLLNKILFAPSVEQRVQALKMQTGFSVFAFYSRAGKAGEARLNLRVTPVAKRGFSLKLDNYGSESSGKQRLIAQYTEHQLTGHFDRLSLAVLQSIDDVANTYGSIGYTLPFAGLRYELDVSASNNQFEVGDRFAILGLEGDSTSVNLGLTHYHNFHPSSRSSWRLGIYDKRSNLKGNDLLSESETSRALTLQWSKRMQSANARWLLNSTLDISKGEFKTPFTETAVDFTKLNLSLFLVHGMAQGRWRNIWQASFRGQLTNEALPGAEGLALTGPYSVRAFAPGAFNADNARLVSLEWRFPNIISGEGKGWRLEPYLLGDWANGEDGIDAQQSEAQYSGYGVGLRWYWGKHLTANLVAAKSNLGREDKIEVASDEQFLFEIRWQ